MVYLQARQNMDTAIQDVAKDQEAENELEAGNELPETFA